MDQYPIEFYRQYNAVEKLYSHILLLIDMAIRWASHGILKHVFAVCNLKNGKTTLLVSKVCLLSAFGPSFKCALLVPKDLNMSAISPFVNFR